MTPTSLQTQSLSCCQCKRNTKRFSFLDVAEKVSMVALTILAAEASLCLLAPSLVAGVGIGIYQHFQSNEARNGRADGTSCSQGFLEQLTKVKLPPLVCLGINLAITWSHVQHHPYIFVPIIGISIGAKGGDLAGRFIEKAWPQVRGSHTSLVTASTCAV